MSIDAEPSRGVAADDLVGSILRAAGDAIVAHGADVPIEVIAHTAGVSPSCVLHHLTDRSTLLQSVAVHVLRRIMDEIELAIDEEQSALAALTRTLHATIEHRVGAVMPALDGRISHADPELTRLVTRVHQTLNTLFERARADGVLSSDAAYGDLLVAARLSRPTVGSLVGPVEDNEMAHRQLDIFLAGLRSADPLPSRGLSFEDVSALLTRRRGASVRA